MRVLRSLIVLGFMSMIGCGNDGSGATGGSAGAGPTGGSGGADSGPFAGYQSEIYASLDPWLCHPGLDAADDVCRQNLDATIVMADGSTELEVHAAATDPQFDCFYVYPTASFDMAGNSDLEANVEERFVVTNQAARFSRACRVFAPVYRQVTLGVIFSPGLQGDGEMAYADVVDSFKHYMANENNGRGVLLIGHSQGSGHLARLIEEEVETNPGVAERLVAAYLLGTTIPVPVGEDVGGRFASTPLCRASDQTGCLVTYASFRDTAPPPEESLFSATSDPNTVAACVNPAALAGGKATLQPYFAGEVMGVFIVALGEPLGPYADPEAFDPITTPFFKMPNFIEAECVERDGFNYLEITVLSDPEDPRADDFTGDFQGGPQWGLHLVDVSLGIGDLVDLAILQGAAWAGNNAP